MDDPSEKELWRTVVEKLGRSEKRLGPHWSYNLFQDPKRLAFVLSRYKFAARMATKNRRVLELGCSEGIGAPILSELAAGYVGVDLDGAAIQAARRNFTDPKREFVEGDFLGQTFGTFGAVVSLDVIEHIPPDDLDRFVGTVGANLAEDGVSVVGTPNVHAQAHASEASRIGHVNLFDADRLRETLERIFHNVFVFSMNDEIVHTGFASMAHYLLALGCHRR